MMCRISRGRSGLHEPHVAWRCTDQGLPCGGEGCTRGCDRSAAGRACGEAIEDCAREDIGRLSNPAANEAFYAVTQTYNLPVVYPKTANTIEDVGKLAPEAGYLLTTAFPSLTLEQADRILTETEGRLS
jgi:hypothetical protein